MTGRTANVFVLGLDDRNLGLLRSLRHAPEYRFHRLLTRAELMHGEVDLPRLVDAAERELADFTGAVDAIVGYWDFPVSSMVPLLCERRGLPSPGLRAVVTCEHKYWSRLEQQRVTDAHPAFALVDLDATGPPPGVGFPMWLKPVKSYSSALAFRVGTPEEFDRAVADIREGVGAVASAFDFLLSLVDVPPEVAEAGGRSCLAEEAVAGRQITAEGYCHRGEPEVYGLVDSVCYPDSPSFLRYQYPSALPAGVDERIGDIATRVIRRIGLRDCTFDIEFFWDDEHDVLNVLEINPRLSQSHAPLFDFVDGTPHHECMVRLALGERPDMPHRRGPHRVAAKWFLRTFTDAVVRGVPAEADIARVEREVPGAIVDVVAEPGRRLSDLPGQDSYSYELAAVYLGGRDEEDLTAKYRRCVELLPFDLEAR
ncbi:ATP-grasp domain-containing protein [Saccharopolyspora rosea]|uniref:Acetyl-CoA carboxylase biotin carboxylase subunit family protein n=1 Tax=Saccharopolyspora rosea TaxID=524884 RepID=A0ABW3FUH8_9PSEU|nr:ATP-grasp domain-containing protein [Saccharopolyspora rosea]